MIRLITKLLRNRRGATAVEYGFILALIVLVLMASLVLMARTTVDVWNNVSGEVANASAQ